MKEDFIVLNLDCAVSPGVEFADEPDQSQQFSSWGFAWYPRGNNASSVFKGGSETPKELIAQTLSDWKRFRSSLFVCHFSQATHGKQHNNIQPFTKSLAGKDWTWLAIGDIPKTELAEKCNLTESVGTTSAEMAFTLVLNFLNQQGFRTIAEVDFEQMYQFLNEQDTFVQANIVLADGQSVLVYRGCESEQAIYLSRMLPPHKTTEMVLDTVTMDIGGSYACHKTVTAISSTPLASDDQSTLEAGGMVVSCLAKIICQKNLVALHGNQQKILPTVKIPTTTSVPILAANNKLTTNIRSITTTTDGTPLNYRSLHVYHRTTYRYSKLVRRSTHVLRLSPVEDQVQSVELASIEFSTACKPIFYEDAFGNRVVHLTVEDPYREFSVISEAKIKVYALPPDDFSSPMRRPQIPLLWMPWQRQMMLPYLLPPELPDSQLSELSEYAMSFVERNDYQLLETLDDINKTIYLDYQYQSGSTSNSTSVFDVYVNRQGVCQDFSNLFICLSRILSVPSRYRMGYIYTGKEYENTIQSDASHAWVEVYLPYIGWRGYDPTNGCHVKQDHIRVACGRNYIDATPTSGTIYKGGGKEELNIEVRIEE